VAAGGPEGNDSRAEAGNNGRGRYAVVEFHEGVTVHHVVQIARLLGERITFVEVRDAERFGSF
jgi:hypothetical protein